MNSYRNRSLKFADKMKYRILAILWIIFFAIYSDAIKMTKLSSKIKFYHHTSSTLHWKPMKKGEHFPKNIVPIDSNNPKIFWCRAYVYSMMIPGGVRENGSCEVVFFKRKVISVLKFDILESINDSARIKFHDWDPYSVKPINALISPDRILAAVPHKNSSILTVGHIGNKDTDRKIITQRKGLLERAQRAYILVEDEPLKYELKDISFFPKYSSESQCSTVLASSVLENENEEELNISSTLSYELTETQYWGKPKGTILGTYTTITHSDPKEPTEIQWGIESVYKRVEFGNISYSLPPHSTVKYYIIGTKNKYDVLYRARLNAIYSDGFARSRSIESLYVKKEIAMVFIKYEVPIFLNGTTLSIRDAKSELVYKLTTTTSTTTSTTPETAPTESTPPETTPPPPETTTPETMILETIPTIERELENPIESTLNNTEWEIEAEWEEFENDTSPATNQDKVIDRITQPYDYDSLKDPKKSTTEKSQMKKPSPTSRTPDSGSKSDKLISALATLFTALVFWYYGG